MVSCCEKSRHTSAHLGKHNRQRAKFCQSGSGRTREALSLGRRAGSPARGLPRAAGPAADVFGAGAIDSVEDDWLVAQVGPLTAVSIASYGTAAGISHPDTRDGELPVAPSAIAAKGDFFLPSGRADFPVPRALETVEVEAIVKDFKQAAVLAKEAGCDGVELHGAFGYLTDPFLQDGPNQRTDAKVSTESSGIRHVSAKYFCKLQGWNFRPAVAATAHSGTA